MADGPLLPLDPLLPDDADSTEESLLPDESDDSLEPDEPDEPEDIELPDKLLGRLKKSGLIGPRNGHAGVRVGDLGDHLPQPLDVDVTLLHELLVEAEDRLRCLGRAS